MYRSSDVHQAHDYHSQALTIAREIGAPLEEARALDGIGRCYLHDGNLDNSSVFRHQALSIYQRIGAPPPATLNEDKGTAG